ncbi:protein PIF-like [Mytilus californianus]|uniref:protein PIF-like n=1 Tax=Mytilus californianus TaxID=6549 RepID=UPI002246D670|nr:protein PIF-like [Mytilus californianus]
MDDSTVTAGFNSNKGLSENAASDSSDEAVDVTNNGKDDSNSNDITDDNENVSFNGKENLVGDQTTEIDSLSKTFENEASDEESQRIESHGIKYKNQEHSEFSYKPKFFNVYDDDSDQNLFAVYGKLHVNKKQNENDKQLPENSASSEVLQACKNIDVIFVVDSSDDVSEKEFRYIKQTLIKISKMLQDYRQMRMGVVSYGSRISDVIHLSNNASVMSRSIQTIKTSKGSNKPYLGILAGRGAFSDDIPDSTKKVIVFIASGLQQYTKPTSQQAKMAREEEINVMTIGYGEGAVRHDFEEVATRRSMVYTYNRAGKVYENADKLPLYICKAAKRRASNDESKNSENNDSSDESDESDENNGKGSASDDNSRSNSDSDVNTSTSNEIDDKSEGSGASSGSDNDSYNESDDWHKRSSNSHDESDMFEKSDENDNSGNSSDDENSDENSDSTSSDKSDKSEIGKDSDASSSDESDNSNDNSNDETNSNSSTSDDSSDENNGNDDSDDSSSDSSNNSNDSDASSSDSSNNSNDSDATSSDSSDKSDDSDASSSDSSNNSDDSDASSSDSSNSEESWNTSDSDEDDKSLLRKKPEDLCRNSKMIRGVGYKVHPTDCDKFIQCYFDGFGNTRASVKSCSFGEYWDQYNVACVDAQIANCPNDPCKAPVLFTRASKNSCRSYWGCHKGQSFVKCCPEKMSYQPRKGCVPDPDCVSECPPEEGPEYGTCDKKPLFGKPYLYKQWIESGHWVEMLCAPGTLFDENDCGCTMRTTHMTSLGVRAIAKETCKPELYLPFCQGFKDWSNKNTLIQNEDDKVVVVNGKAYFDGKSSLFIPRFSGAHYGESIYIKIRYKPDFSDDAPDVQADDTNESVYETRRKRSILSRQRRGSKIENDGQNGDAAGTTNTEHNQNVEFNMEPTNQVGESMADMEITNQNAEASFSNVEVNNDINDATDSVNEKGLSDDTTGAGDSTTNQADDNKISTSQSSGEVGNVQDWNSKNKDGGGDGNDNSISMSKSSGEIGKSDDKIGDGKGSDSDSGEQYSSFFETSHFDDQRGAHYDYNFDKIDNSIQNAQNTVNEVNDGNSNEDESYFTNWFSNGDDNSVKNDNSEYKVSSNVQNDKDSGSGESYFKNWFANSDENGNDDNKRGSDEIMSTYQKSSGSSDFFSNSGLVDVIQDQTNGQARSHERIDQNNGISVQRVKQRNDGSSGEDNGKQNQNMKVFQSSSYKGRKFRHGFGEKRDFYRDYSSDEINNEGDAVEIWENSSEENSKHRRKLRTRNDSDNSDDSKGSDDSSNQKKRRKNTRRSSNSDKDTDSDVSSAISEGYVDSNFELSSDFGNSNLRTSLGSQLQKEEMYFAKTNIDEKRERLKFISRIRRERNEMLQEMENSRKEIINNVNLKKERFRKSSRSDMALISNGACSSMSKSGCLEDPSLSIGTNSETTTCSVYATESKRTNIKLNKSDKDDDDWRTVIFTINEGVFRAYDEDSTDFEPVSGPVKTTFSGIYIGKGTGMENFKGYMDEVYIYFCKPDELDDFKSMELPKKKNSSDDSCDYMNENIVKQNSESNEEIIVEPVEPWWGE